LDLEKKQTEGFSVIIQTRTDATSDISEDHMKSNLFWALVVCACAFTGTPQADWWEDTKDVLAYKYDRSKEAILNGRNDYFISGLIYHAPWAYDSHSHAEANEAGYGVGFGRSVVDPNGNTHTLYMQVFRASHYKPQYNVGYLWTIPTGPCSAGCRVVSVIPCSSLCGRTWVIQVSNASGAAGRDAALQKC
jgi:hypothetical protein